MTRDLFALAYRMLQDESEAKDVVQDTLVKLWQARAQLPQDGADKAYCMAMVRNRCFDILRRQKIIQIQALTPDEEEPPEIPDGDFYSRIEAQDYLEKLLQELPPSAKLIVELRLRDGYTFKEIEQLTGISEGNARVILSRTLKQLRQ